MEACLQGSLVRLIKRFDKLSDLIDLADLSDALNPTMDTTSTLNAGRSNTKVADNAPEHGAPDDSTGHTDALDTFDAGKPEGVLPRHPVNATMGPVTKDEQEAEKADEHEDEVEGKGDEEDGEGEDEDAARPVSDIFLFR